jgi:hypothetical protein
VRAHGSLGRKEASAYFLSRDAYSRVADEQKTGRRSKSGVVIFSFVATPQRKTRSSTGRRRPAFRHFRCRHSDAAPNEKSVVRRRSGASYFAQSLDGQGRTLSKQYANANQARLN